MKGIFIFEQMEIVLSVEGEEFCQGNSLLCNLVVKNRGDGPRSISDLQINLCHSKLGKGKKKGEESLFIISSAPPIASVEIAPGETEKMSHTFELNKDCTISDKTETLCFTYGIENNSASMSTLPLQIHPHRYIQQIIEVFESAFQFIEKSKHSNQDYVDIKFKPSSAQKFTLLEELILGVRIDEESISLKYLFKVKKLHTTASSVGVTKEKNEREQKLDLKKCLLSKDFIDNGFFEAAIEESLASVATTVWG